MSQSIISGQMVSISPYLHALSQVPNPARTFHYEENIGRWAWATRREIDDCTWIGQGVDPGPTKSVRGWHARDWTYNFAFVDGHVATRQIYRDGTEDSDGYAHHYSNEELDSYPIWPDCSQCPRGATDCPGDQTEFQNLRCVIIRGPDWQKDILPTQPTCTGLTYHGSGRPSYESCVASD